MGDIPVLKPSEVIAILEAMGFFEATPKGADTGVDGYIPIVPHSNEVVKSTTLALRRQSRRLFPLIVLTAQRRSYVFGIDLYNGSRYNPNHDKILSRPGYRRCL